MNALEKLANVRINSKFKSLDGLERFGAANIPGTIIELTSWPKLREESNSQSQYVELDVSLTYLDGSVHGTGWGLNKDLGDIFVKHVICEKHFLIG